MEVERVQQLNEINQLNPGKVYQRQDKRGPFDLQELFFKTNIKKNTSSSLYMETPYLKMLCYVNGPIYSTMKTEKTTKMSIRVNVKFPQYLNDKSFNYENRNLTSYKLQIESSLLNIFSQNILVDKYYKTNLDINVEVYEFSCDFLHYAIMGISQCLMFANIEQKGLIMCSKLVLIGNSLVVDPSFEEEKQSSYKLIFGAVIDLQENNIFIQKGSTSDEIYKSAVGCSIKICEKYQELFLSKCQLEA